ncbi:MAG: hypothetical protein KBA61_16825 [Spirochaetes bacterium]|nr:hypothetical protein [Spirochaetota bacterium]
MFAEMNALNPEWLFLRARSFHSFRASSPMARHSATSAAKAFRHAICPCDFGSCGTTCLLAQAVPLRS